ncbi:MAG: cell division inhibitor SepF [Acidimicrobiales bacterium]|jgi:FtsZ-interacting cell division protein YlmF
MAVFRNVMVYLGLGPDEEYEDGYLFDDDEAADGGVASVDGGRPAATGWPDESESRLAEEAPSTSAVGAVRPLRTVGAIDGREVLDLAEAERRAQQRVPAEVGARSAQGSDRERPSADAGRGLGGRTDQSSHTGFGTTMPSDASGGHRTEPIVRAVPIPRTKPLAVVPETFADAKNIADEFKRSVPVVMNLQGLDRELARRLIDFASGVCYSMNGSMEKIASQVFLLTPKSVDVSDEDMRRIEERGFGR